MPVRPPDLVDAFIDLERRLRVLESQSYLEGSEDALGIDLDITGLDFEVFYNIDYLQQIVSARIALTWDEIISDPDDSGYDPVHYEVRYSVEDDDSWTSVRSVYTNEVSIDGLPLGYAVFVQVRAMAKSGRHGTWIEVEVDTSSDGTFPAKPSVPVATGIYQGIRVQWDGLDYLGLPMGGIFSHVEVHLSQTTGFSLTTSTLRGYIIGGAGSISIPVDDMGVWYTKLRAVDRKGAKSTNSAQASATPTSSPLDPTVLTTTNTLVADNKTIKGPLLADDTDATKLVALGIASIPTGTTRTWAFPNLASTSFVGVAGDQKLTEKRIKLRVASFGSGATRTVDVSTENMMALTALSQASTAGVPGGSPDEGDVIYYRYKDNGTARALAWNAIYRAQAGAGAQALPTTTTVGRTMYVKYIYNATDTKWDLEKWWEV